VVFLDGTLHRRIDYDTLDDAVRAMRGYLEGGVSVDKLSDQA
jgi:hypothetical protein